jgi:outer membrane protein assembly factor BamB
MKHIPYPDRSTPAGAHVRTETSCHDRLLASLLGPGASGLELPSVTDLALSLVALAEGKRRKAILPLASSTGEFALVRRGSDVLLSYYDSGPVPQIFIRDRVLDLAALIALCGEAASELSEQAESGRTGLVIAERARRVTLAPDRQLPPAALVRRGGAGVAREGSPLSFGFWAKISAAEMPLSESGARADLHALLFDGELWAHAHGRRLLLVKGPIFPAISRMVSAARSVIEAWESQRPLCLKLRAGEFGIGVRMSRRAELALTLLGPLSEPVTLPALDVPSALLPILRVAADFVRAVVGTDRSQAKNLRLTSLRDEVRALRRTLRGKAGQKSFVNCDAELLRASSAPPPAPRERDDAPPARVPESSGRLRLALRWRAEVEGLDASATFLCGDRLVVATPRSQLALSRDDGELLWVTQRSAAATLMAGTSLICVGADGNVELCDLTDGEAYARARVMPRAGGALLGLCAGGRGAPPVAVITEGRDRLVAIDTRTGEPRWRFRSGGRGDFRLTRAGRIMLVVSGDSALDAIDVASGEVVWRWSDPGRITLPPVVARDRVIAVSGQPGSPAGALLCLDLFSGQLCFRRELPSGPLASPSAGEQLALVSVLENGTPVLAAHDLQSGEPRWRRDDPGLADGGAALVVDQRLVINAALGSLSGVDLSSGELAWQHQLADPVRDDVPRRLEPVLRGGALFVPSANVHVVRPADGTLMSAPITDSVIPDFMRVDERGWLYLAEESGHIEAYAPAPHLRLIK